MNRCSARAFSPSCSPICINGIGTALLAVAVLPDASSACRNTLALSRVYRSILQIFSAIGTGMSIAARQIPSARVPGTQQRGLT